MGRLPGRGSRSDQGRGKRLCAALDPRRSLALCVLAARIPPPPHLALLHPEAEGNTLVDRPALEEVLAVAFAQGGSTLGPVGGEGVASGTSPDTAGIPLGIQHVQAYFHVLDAFALPRFRFRPEDGVFLQ